MDNYHKYLKYKQKYINLLKKGGYTNQSEAYGDSSKWGDYAVDFYPGAPSIKNYYPSEHPVIYNRYKINNQSLKIYSWNCDLAGRRNIGEFENTLYPVFVKSVINVIEDIISYGADIILLQECDVKFINETLGIRFKKFINNLNYRVVGAFCQPYGVVTIYKSDITIVNRDDINITSLPIIFDERRNITISYNNHEIDRECLQSGPIDKSSDSRIQYPPFICYYDMKFGRYAVGKNTSLDIIISLNGNNIRIRNLHFSVGSYSYLNPIFLEKEPNESLIIGGDFNSQHWTTGNQVYISQDWRPRTGNSTILNNFGFSGRWNDGFIFSNDIILVNDDIYLVDPSLNRKLYSSKKWVALNNIYNDPEFYRLYSKLDKGLTIPFIL